MSAPVTPLLAADVIIELEGTGRGIVLIERRNPPHGWALPGGFVDIGETVERAAVREALEETSLAVTLHCLLGCYSDPGRDPRGHTVSLVFVARARGVPHARDDARSVRVVDPGAIAVSLAFDHARIVEDYLCYRESGYSPGWFPRGV
ncbi:MAG: NUDIX domain-containing protein [Gammaproteobacteria bacterium]